MASAASTASCKPSAEDACATPAQLFGQVVRQPAAASSAASGATASEETPLLADKAHGSESGIARHWESSLHQSTNHHSARMEHIEALRFLCCCMVICYHYGSPGIGFDSITSIRYFLARHAYASYTPLVGVLNSSYPASVFFTISGYALASKFVKRRDFKELHFQCHKRLLRILPCCLCVVALYEFQVRVGLLALLARGQFYTRKSWLEAQDGYFPGVRECGLLGPICHGLGVSTPFWAILFEIIAPHYLLLLAHLSPPPNAGLVGQRWLSAFSFVGLPLLTPFTYPLSGFAAGYFLAEQDVLWTSWRVKRGKDQKSQRGIIVAVTFAFHSLAGSMVDPFHCIHLHWCGICYQLSGSALVWLISASPRAQWLLRTSGLQHLGYLAFALFVVHLLVIKDMGFVREKWPEAAPFIAFAEVALLALILNRFVEAPCAALADMYANWMTATPRVKAEVWMAVDHESGGRKQQADKQPVDV